MKPPRCDLCGTDHHKHQAANAVANKRKNPPRYKDADKRRAYMRELMRKVRERRKQAAG